MTDLRSSLHRLADSTEPLPVDDGLWRRAQSARRRGQVLAVAALVVLVAAVGGLAGLGPTADREARTASGEVPQGAIPSRIDDPGRLRLETDLAVGRASVAFVSAAGQAVVVGAVDGRHHALDLTGWDGGLLSLSPDGTHLAWTIESDPDGRPRDGFELMDLSTGDFRLMSSGAEGLITPEGLSWSPSSRWLTWFAGASVSRAPVVDTDPTATPSSAGSATRQRVEWSAVDDTGVVTFYAEGPRRWGEGAYGRMRTADDAAFAADRQGRNDSAVASPSGDTIALATTTAAPGADFLVAGRFEERGLATDLYPDGVASTTPLGWAADGLLLAAVEGPPGSYVEGSHLALMTSPDRPQDEWTYRVLVRDVPDVTHLSVAVDLVPDLDGTSSQELTHDFDDRAVVGDPLAPGGVEIALLAGLGLAVVAVLLVLRWVWRRLRTPV